MDKVLNQAIDSFYNGHELDVSRFVELFKDPNNGDVIVVTNEKLCSYTQNGNEDALLLLLLNNQQIVEKTLEQYYSLDDTRISNDGIIKHLNLAMIDAVISFDTRINQKFTVYCKHLLLNSMKRYIDSDGFRDLIN